MKFLQKISVVLLLLPLLWTDTVNAKQDSTPTKRNIITQIQVFCRRGNCIIDRNYLQPHKIGAVLNYLRLLRYSSVSGTDPEQINTDCFVIVLYDTAGKCTVYRQRGNRFFSKNSGPWKSIALEQASQLFPLIRSMSSDTERACSI